MNINTFKKLKKLNLMNLFREKCKIITNLSNYHSFTFIPFKNNFLY